VIDPLDGTTNFYAWHSIVGISIGLLYQRYSVFGFVQNADFETIVLRVLGGDSGLVVPWVRFVMGLRSRLVLIISSNHFFNLCARSIGVLKNPIPTKIRMLGISTYNVLSVAIGYSVRRCRIDTKDLGYCGDLGDCSGGRWLLGCA
jgi:myo-inositol-1(or 4)-monophosphatase